MRNIEELEKRIQYRFEDRSYLERALTHSSYNREKNTKHKDNERLEFLGDAFLDAIVGAELFVRMNSVTEGTLTKTRALIVCEKALAEVAREFNLGKYILMGHGEAGTGGRNKDSILADAFEAIIGAICMDGGMEAVTKYIMGFMEERIESTKSNFRSLDCKTHLQEVIQKTSKVPLKYAIVDEHGPDHNKVFVAEVTHDGAVLGKGSGKSKKEAEQNAANDALERMNQAKK